MSFLSKINSKDVARPFKAKTRREKVFTNKIARVEADRNSRSVKQEKGLATPLVGKISLKSLGGAFNGTMKEISTMVLRKNKLKTEKEMFEKKYVGIDIKGGTSTPFDEQLALMDQVIKGLRGVARGFVGTKVLKMKLYSTFYYNTSAGGLIASAIALDPSGLTEFASCAAIFDEFKVLGGQYDFDNMGYITNTGTGLNSYGTIAYDPTDGTTPASLVTMSQLEQHKLCFKTTLVAATTNPFVNNKPSKFTWHVPPGTITEIANPATAGTSNWQPTGITPQPYGWLKAYFDNLQASTTGLSGQLTYHVEFRCRE